MNLVPTELNRRLSSAVENAVAAEQFYVGGRAGFWRLVGLGLICFGLGGALGLSFYGYAYIARTENLSSLSATFAKALSETQLKGQVEGTVQIEPHEIALAKNQTISIDNNARLHLEQNAQVSADGEIRVQLPMPAPMPLTNTPRTTSQRPLITNFTVFKRVPFQNGSVMTGWIFLTSKQRSPTSQYCYYTQHSNDAGTDSYLPGLSVDLDLGQDQRKLNLPKSAPKDFDGTAAFARCVWFQS